MDGLRERIAICVIALGFFIVGCASFGISEKRREHKELFVVASDLEQEYKVLGEVEAELLNIPFPVSEDQLDEKLRINARRRYGDVDAVIKVHYSSDTIGEGIVDLDVSKKARGIAVRFVKGERPSLDIRKLAETLSSPPGRYPDCDIVFTSDLHNVGVDEQGLELYGIKSDGSHLRRITYNNYFEFHADVSPVREEILTVTLFEKGSDPGGELDIESELAIWDFEGNLVKRLTDNKRPESVPHWSPDGERIVFFAGRGIGSLNIYIINRDGSGERQLTHGGYDVDPSFSPGGKIIFSRGKKIMIMNADGSDLRTLISLDISPEDPIFIDSERMAFEAKTGASGNWGLGDYDIFLINRDGTDLRDLSRNGFADAMPQPVGDDKITFWRVTDGNGTFLMIMDRDGGNKRDLLNRVANSQMPTGNN